MYTKWLLLQSGLVVRQPIIDKTSAEVKEIRLEYDVLKEKVNSMEKILNEMKLGIMKIVENSEIGKSDIKELFGNKTAQEIDEISRE